MRTPDRADIGASGGVIPISSKGIQPRIVFGLLLIGSFAGIWIAHRGESVVLRTILWLGVVSLGGLIGGLYWRIILFPGARFDVALIQDFVRARWRQLETIYLWMGVVTVVSYFTVIDISSRFNGTVFLGGFSFAVVWIAVRYSTKENSPRTRSYLRRGLLILGVGSLLGIAWIETGTTLIDWGVRVVHLGAFALWFGGATWHNFIVRPIVTSRPEAARPLKSQARSFRRHLALIIPLLFLTGGYQTIQIVGSQVWMLVTSDFGRLIGLKIFILIILTSLVLVTLKRSSHSSHGVSNSS